MSKIGVFAPSSPVGQVELRRGVSFLRSQGMDVTIHPQVSAHHFLFAGSDQERASAIFKLACDQRIDILWAARGGYGAQRILPLLADWTRRHGKPPRKLLVGYSDITVLHEFVRRHWGWSTLHAPMPSSSTLRTLKRSTHQVLFQLMAGQMVPYPATNKKMTWMTSRPKRAIRAELVGGNLSLWQSLVGTPWEPTPGKGRILFFEDVDEKLYRIDRMITQIAQAGLLNGAAAIVLGDFTHCDDEKHSRLASESSTRQIPLRRTYSLRQALEEIFTPVCRQLKVPLIRGLPVGHGPNYCPLPLGAKYELTPAGELRMLSWSWTDSK